MRTLHAYLLRQVIATLGVTVAVFTTLLLLGSVLKEVLELLTSQSATAGLVLKAVALLIPFVLAFSLPMAFLTATLLVFGRLSADHELTAVRNGGVSLITWVAPVLGLSVVMSALCGWFNLDVAPRCRAAFTDLRDSIIREVGSRMIAEERFIDIGNNLTLYARQVRGRQLNEILIYGLTNQVEAGVTNLVRNLDVWAPEGEIESQPGGGEALVLHRLQGLIWTEGEWRSVAYEKYTEPLPTKATARSPIKISDMTFRQLLAERRGRQLAGQALTPVDVQLQRQVSFSFACIGFTLVGIPLGIRAHRRETNTGVAIALLLVLVYYSFLIVGQALETRPEWHPAWVLWAPNFLFQGLGGWLLWRANSKV